MDDVEWKVVGLDLFTGGTSVVTGLLLAEGIGFRADLWWVGVLVAVGAGGLIAAADRRRVGVYALLAGGALAMAGVVWAISADAGAVVPVALIGIGVGACLNRIAFGVLRPVPPARRRRQGSG